jgi:hypothetical protein
MNEAGRIETAALNKAVGAFGSYLLQHGVIVTFDEDDAHLLDEAMTMAIRAYFDASRAP